MRKPPAKPARRNPEARELRSNPLYRAKVMKSAEAIAVRDDAWNRRAKHRRRPKPTTEEE